MKIKLKRDEIREYLDVPEYEFPKYTRPLMNLANQHSRATRPENVGQMTDLIQECPGNIFEEWAEWYEEKYPDTIDKATDKIVAMLENHNEASLKIDRSIVRLWVKDLVLGKSFTGLKFQAAILKRLAKIKGCDYRLAEPHEESKGIDGFVGEEAYSVKPKSFNPLPNLPISIEVKIIRYDKKDDGSVVFKIPED